MLLTRSTYRPRLMSTEHAPAIWTIGHSTHAIETFLGLLASQSIECLADVRRFPGSRRHPQFRQESLKQSLADAGIEYVHFPALGGRRSGRLPDSPNGAWRVEAFNTYADYMLSAEFEQALAELVELAGRQSRRHVAEALPLEVPSPADLRPAQCPRLEHAAHRDRAAGRGASAPGVCPRWGGRGNVPGVVLGRGVRRFSLSRKRRSFDSRSFL